jgi:hypothetical protein
MSKRQLIEHGAILESVAGSKTIPIRIITEGKGTTAVYTREFLESNKDIFADRPMYMGHPEDVTKPHKRIPENIAARTGKVVEYKVVDGVAGLYTDAKPRDKYRDLIEGFGDLFGVSVFTPSSNGSDDENGDYIVESVDDSPLISVDFVSAAGAGGRIESLMESLAEIEQPGKPSVPTAQEKKDNKKMDEKLEKLITLLESFIAESKAKVDGEAQAKVDQETIDKAIKESVESYDAAVAVIDAAELLPSQRASLREAAKRGDDVAPLVESAKKVLEEARSSALVEDGSGRSIGAGAEVDYSVGAWR